MQLTLKGKVSLYAAKGKFQFIVDSLYPIGHGILYDNFEKLKIKLKNEGLFLDEYKKKIIKFPVTVGIITSLEGAVIKDVIKVSVGDIPKLVPPLAIGSSITLSTSLVIISVLEWLFEDPSSFICTTLSLIANS